MPSDVLTISREDLYELVWSKPMVELAADFGLSDVAVAKRCRKLGVPVPGRGYWARVAAGQTPHRPKLRARAEERSDRSAMEFQVPAEEHDETKAAESSVPKHTALRQRIDGLEVSATTDLMAASVSGAVKRTAVQLKRPCRKELVWAAGERRGPTVRIAVGVAQADRALRMADTVLRAAEAMGWKFIAPVPVTDDRSHRYGRYASAEEPCPAPFGQLMVEGEALRFRVDERQQRSEHVLTEDEKARKRLGEYVYPPRWDYEASGELRLHLSDGDSDYAWKTFKDGRRLKLEDQVKAVLQALLDRALELKARREERRLEEIEARREAELERQRGERRDAELKRVVELERQAGAWFRARVLRRYVQAARRALGSERILVEQQGGQLDFFEWASTYVDQLDPLHVTARNPDLARERYGWHRPDGYKEELSRLIGHEWPASWKLVGGI